MDIAHFAHLHCTTFRAMDKEVEEVMIRFR